MDDGAEREAVAPRGAHVGHAHTGVAGAGPGAPHLEGLGALDHSEAVEGTVGINGSFLNRCSQ